LTWIETPLLGWKDRLSHIFFSFDSLIRSRRHLHAGCAGNQIWAGATRLCVWVSSSLSLDRLHLVPIPPFPRASISSAIPFVFRTWEFWFFPDSQFYFLVSHLQPTWVVRCDCLWLIPVCSLLVFFRLRSCFQFPLPVTSVRGVEFLACYTYSGFLRTGLR
jgi:hypothetical protein